MRQTDDTQGADGSAGTPSPASYQAPRIEQVLTPAQLEQEILYAGADSGQPG